MSDVDSVLKAVGIGLLAVGGAGFGRYMFTVNRKLQEFTKSQRDVFYEISCSRKSDEIPTKVNINKMFLGNLSNTREKKICNVFVKGKAASDVLHKKRISNSVQRIKNGLTTDTNCMSIYIQSGTPASPVIEVTDVERLIFPAGRERRMKVGDTVYCIGDIVIKNGNNVSLEPPSDGSGYIFSTEDILLQYIDFLKVRKRWQTLKMLAVGLSVAVLSVGICWYYCRRKQDKKKKTCKCNQSQPTERTKNVNEDDKNN